MADLPGPPAPPLRPDTLEPAGPDDLSPIFPMGLIQQEVSADAGDRDPGARFGRSTSSGGRRRCSVPAASSGRSIRPRTSTTSTRALRRRARTSPTRRSRRPTTTAGGRQAASTETGAGQWGSALALACRLMEMECVVFMVGSSYDQKPYRRSMMEVWGATVHRSPSGGDRRGPRPGRTRHRLARNRDLRGGRGGRRRRPDQLRARLGPQSRAPPPDRDRPGGDGADGKGGRVPGHRDRCVGGGSNFAGIANPFLRANLRDGKSTRFIACEPAACPTLTRGVYRSDFGDTMGMTPLMPMYTLGHDFVPPPVHAGGLRYHGDAPLYPGS